MSASIKNPPLLSLIGAALACLLASVALGRLAPDLALLRWLFVFAAVGLFALAFGPRGRLVWLARKPALFASFAALALAQAWPFTLAFAVAATAAVLLGAPSSAPGPGPADLAGTEPGAAAPAEAASSAARIAVAQASVIGKEGAGQAEFKEPHGIALAPDGTIYVADTGNKRVQVLDKDGKFMREIRAGKEPFLQPFDVALASNGDVFVLDSERGVIERFDPAGKFISSFGANLAFYFPRDLAIDAQDNLYVADTGGSRVVKVSPTGDILFAWGEKGRGLGQFTEPTGVAVADDGTVYTVDPTNRRLSVFKADGAFVRDTVVDGAGTVNASKLTIEPEGTLLVSAPEKGEIRRYDRNLQVLGAIGAPGQEPGEFRLPTYVMRQGPTLWVVDSLNHRLQKLTLG